MLKRDPALPDLGAKLTRRRRRRRRPAAAGSERLGGGGHEEGCRGRFKEGLDLHVVVAIGLDDAMVHSANECTSGVILLYCVMLGGGVKIYYVM